MNVLPKESNLINSKDSNEIKSSNCFHCQNPIPKNVNVSNQIQGESRYFCCTGCLTVSEIISQMGNTGRSTGTHLHMGIYDVNSGTYIDPLGLYQ